MELKRTKKEMRQNYCKIIKIEYYQAESLLYYAEPIAYSAGVYGWICDYYDIDGVLISTGYAPLNNKNTYADIDMISKYEKKAETIRYSNQDCDIKKTQVTALLKEFVKEAETNSW